LSLLYTQGKHFCGNPGNVAELDSC